MGRRAPRHREDKGERVVSEADGLPEGLDSVVAGQMEALAHYCAVRGTAVPVATHVITGDSKRLVEVTTTGDWTFDWWDSADVN